MTSESYVLRPNPDDPALTRVVSGVDETGHPVTTRVTVERALTLYLNAREIVTMMTILDYPAELAVGYLLNQAMLKPDDVVTGIDYDRSHGHRNQFRRQAQEEDADIGLRARYCVRRFDGGA